MVKEMWFYWVFDSTCFIIFFFVFDGQIFSWQMLQMSEILKHLNSFQEKREEGKIAETHESFFVFLTVYRHDIQMALMYTTRHTIML